MIQDFKEVVNKLNNSGFSKMTEQMSESFGDFCTDFSNSEVIIRLLRDRSKEDILIANETDTQFWNGNKMYKWYQIQSVGEMFFGKSKNSFGDSKSFFCENFNDILSLFNNQSYIETKKKMESL